MSDPRINQDLASRLIAEQFPHWAALPVRPVKQSGWDNRTFHLGTDLAIRLPSASRYAAQVPKEQRWLPILAPYLPVRIPRPVEMGHPSSEYPFHWSVMEWIPGTTAEDMNEQDLQSVAIDLATTLKALQAAPTTHGPAAGT